MAVATLREHTRSFFGLCYACLSGLSSDGPRCRFIGEVGLALALVLPLLSAVPVHAAESLRTGEIALSTCDHDAGAICSLTWRRKQFIDDYDHGCQLQSAVSFDGRGESENPTEAGAS